MNSDQTPRKAVGFVGYYLSPDGTPTGVFFPPLHGVLRDEPLPHYTKIDAMMRKVSRYLDTRRAREQSPVT